MKFKTLLSLVALFFIVSSTQAQLSLGLKGSVTQSWYGYDANPFAKGSDNKLAGMGASVQLYYRLGKRLSFGVEPGVVQRGAIKPITSSCIGFCGTGINFTEFPYNNPTIYAEYVQLPVFIRYSFPMFKGNLEVSGKLGAGTSIAISAYQKMDYSTYSDGSDIEQIKFNEEDGFERKDGGLYGGLGIGHRIGPGTLVFEAELYRGLKVINSHYFGFKNQSQSFSLGYRIDM